jgi:hypothetical protein
MEATEMNPKQEQWLLIAFCGLMVVLSFGAIAWSVVTGLIWDIDGLTLVLSALPMGGLFSLFLFFLLKNAGLLPQRKSSAPNGDSGESPEGK